MSLGKKLFLGGTPGPCITDSVNPFDDGLTSSKALYQFDGNANDTAGNYNATASSGVTYTSGYIGQAATMGGNDSINTNDGGALLGDAWSISFFVKFDNANDYEYIAANWRSNPTPRLTSWYLLKRNSSNSNVLEFNVYGSNGTNSNYKQFIAPVSSAFTSNTWYHIAISFNGLSATDVGMYINGLPVSYTTSTGSGWDGSAQISNTLDTTIGGLANSSGGDNYLDGQIDQVRFFNKAISDAEAVILGNETTDTASDVNVLNDGSGAALYSLDYDASDVSGNHDGTATNVTFGVDGQINYGAEFNGSSSRIQIASTATAPLNVSSGNFSISMWVNPSNLTNNNKLIYKWGTSASLRNWFATITTNGVLYVVEGTTAGDTLMLGTTTIPINAWTHIAITRAQGGNLVQYINGVATNTFSTQNRSLKISTEPLYIGYQAGQSTNFTGSIDQVRMFIKELSSTEVSTLYAETACVYTSTTDQVNYQGTNLAYYKFDNTAEDETGNYDGTGYNLSYTFGRFGQCADFNGLTSSSGTYISVPHNTSFSWKNNKTLSLWFKLDSYLSGSRGLVAKGNGGSGPFGWYLYKNGSDNKIGFTYYDSATNAATLVTNNAVDLNTWYHLCVTTDGTTDKLYLNGAEEDSISSIVGIDVNTPLVIGRFYSNFTDYNIDGQIDQVRFYELALDATAVQNLYNEKPEVNTSNFETVLYKGNGGSQYISNVGFQPDLVWIKSRGINYDHQLHDSVRGAGNGLLSNSNVASVFYNTVTSFDSNGFFVNAPGTYVGTNANNQDFVAWVWKGGGDAVNNTDGNITSQVSVNQNAGFSIVKWTGNDSANATIGHGLNSAPELYIIKKTSAAADWQANLASSVTGTAGYLTLNGDATIYTTFPNYYTSANSTVLSTNGTTNAERLYNNQSADYIAYCFHSVTGYQKMGVYTGNGNNSGPIITTGFRPRFVMVKGSSINKSWRVQDDKRGYSSSTGVVESQLEWNTTSIEGTGADRVKFTDTGFQIVTGSAGWNSSGQQYIYLAIA